uniref:Uncharacterized protein n=1 Tax=Mycena chlorophos TaxID=658473 RepID=A0ABQ0M1S8_MYCCL|nr:predicted protein [Mycena chlorophos]
MTASISPWTARKDVCDFIAVHPIPEGVAKEDFAVQHRALLEQLARIPVVQKRFRKMVQYIQTDEATDWLVQAGLAAPRAMVITHAVLERAEHLQEVVRDEEVKALIHEAKTEITGYDTGATLGTVDGLMQTGDHLNVNDGDYHTAFAVFKVPTGPESTQEKFQEDIRLLMEKFLQTKGYKNLLVTQLLWTTNSKVHKDIENHLGMPARETLVIGKYEFVGGMAQVMSSPDCARFIREDMGQKGVFSAQRPLVEGDLFIAQNQLSLAAPSLRCQIPFCEDFLSPTLRLDHIGDSRSRFFHCPPWAFERFRCCHGGRNGPYINPRSVGSGIRSGLCIHTHSFPSPNSTSSASRAHDLNRNHPCHRTCPAQTLRRNASKA